MQRSNEIQGLRALAVALVLLFHAGWLPGGFIGVDVFYVISGYLITSLIINDNEFSFAKFYSRRAKRLLPASFLVLFITAVAFWFLAPSTLRTQFAKDLIGSTWYVSNYLFAHWQNDYQNLGATPSPLIHFWSLAVEEQFYIFWPLLLVLTIKFRKQMIFVVTVSSFLLSILLIKHAPIFAFYSLPTRAFELGIGALLTIIRFRAKLIWPGMFLILLASWTFDSQTPFPGFPALLPVLSAAAILISNQENWILSNPIAVKIGDWSYSIYLWHWPLLTIPPLYLQRELGDKEKIIILIFTIFLAALTYHFVENPVRKSKIKSEKVFISAIFAGVVLTLAGIGMNAKASDINYDLSKPLIYSNGCHQGYAKMKIDSNCYFGDRNANESIALLGDSHAAQWFPALDIWAKKRHFKLYVFTKSSCPALKLPLKDNGGFSASNCNLFREEALARIKKLNPKIVVLGNFEHYKVSSSYYSNGDNYNFKHLLIRDTPWPNRDIPICLSAGKECFTKLPNYIQYRSENIFDPIPLLCSIKCPPKVDGLLAYRDQTHITVSMARHLESRLGAKLDSLMAG